MIAITALIRDRMLRERLQAAFSGRYPVRAVRTADDLWAELQERPVALVVLEAGPPSVADVPSLVRTMRTRHPSVPIVAHCHLRRGLATDVFGLVRAGVHNILFAGVDDDWPRLVALVSRAVHRSVAGDVAAHAAASGMARDGLSLLRAFLDAAARPLSVKGVAGGIGFHWRTLFKRLESARLPAPRRSGRGAACS